MIVTYIVAVMQHYKPLKQNAHLPCMKFCQSQVSHSWRVIGNSDQEGKTLLIAIRVQRLDTTNVRLMVGKSSSN